VGARSGTECRRVGANHGPVMGDAASSPVIETSPAADGRDRERDGRGKDWVQPTGIRSMERIILNVCVRAPVLWDGKEGARVPRIRAQEPTQCAGEVSRVEIIQIAFRIALLPGEFLIDVIQPWTELFCAPSRDATGISSPKGR
jgi:hypothetical protein